MARLVWALAAVAAVQTRLAAGGAAGAFSCQPYAELHSLFKYALQPGAMMPLMLLDALLYFFLISRTTVACFISRILSVSSRPTTVSYANGGLDWKARPLLSLLPSDSPSPTD